MGDDPLPAEVDPLMDAIATQAAEYAVGRYGLHLSKDRQLRLWERHYDGALASLVAYQDILDAQKVRREAFECLN